MEYGFHEKTFCEFKQSGNVSEATFGYYSGNIDGMYGEQTEIAVNRFQKDFGFEERNYVTLGVARAMLEASVE